MKAGMDGAIVSAAKILPLSKIAEEHQQVCRDLIYDNRKFGRRGYLHLRAVDEADGNFCGWTVN